MEIAPSRDARPGIAGIIIAALLFAMIFTAGVGYLLFQTQADQVSYNADVQAQSARQLQTQEQLVFTASVSGTTLTVTVNDTGAIPLSVVSWFVKDMNLKVFDPPGVVGLASPLNLNVGGVGQITLGGYTYPAGNPLVYISLLTSRGNVFTQQYPLTATVTTTTVSSVTSTTVTGPGTGGGNALVVVMAATPVQAFSGNIITNNVTVYNYANVQMTGVTLVPATPTNSVTGTASVVPLGCSTALTPPGASPDPSATIPAYSGAGLAPHLYFLCTYKALSGQVGGLASFSGAANATEGANVVYSASVTSNLVQIGGVTNPLAQGAFTSNFFFFKYSSCTNPPTGGFSGGFSYSQPCITNVPMPPTNPNNLPEGAVVSGSGNYYVAFYVELTNNFNTTLPLLQYTFEQFDASAGSESDWWLAGTNMSISNGAYYPNYSPGGNGVPTLKAYPTDCSNVYTSASPGHPANSPKDQNCIYVNPGQSVVITLAACGPGLNAWDWGGYQYGTNFDGGGGACTSSPPYIDNGGNALGSATAGTTVISFEYKGATLTEDIAFQGVAFTG